MLPILAEQTKNQEVNLAIEGAAHPAFKFESKARQNFRPRVVRSDAAGNAVALKVSPHVAPEGTDKVTVKRSG